MSQKTGICWLFVCIAACTPSGPEPDRSDEVFDPARLLEIKIELPDADWEYIRNQGRDLTAVADDCLAGPPVKIYEFFPGTVTIDGETLHDVGVRKKGFLGSLLVSRPSLKLKFDEFVPGQLYYGMRRMTLNNNKQDPSLARTCMAYRVFTQAGIATPRCNFAHVTVNGEDLGIYSHVESIKKRFLRRHFDNDNGHLYEIQRSDFRPVWLNTFEVKTNLLDDDRSDIEALTEALAVEDDRLLAEIEPLVDVDEFYTFWAAENLMGFYDGYTNDANNSFVYHDPGSDKFHFIPWGPDNAFHLRFELDYGPSRPWSVSAYGMLANRLYSLKGGDTRYVDRMRQLFDTVWAEDELLAGIDRIEVLLGPHAHEEGLDQIRGFIRDRRAVIEAEFADGPPAWQRGLIDNACFITGPPVSGNFSTTWDSLDSSNPFGPGSGEMSIELDGQVQTFSLVASQAGPDESGVSGQSEVRIIGLRDDNSVVVIVLMVEHALLQPGAEIKFQGFTNMGMVLTFTVSGDYTFKGFVSAGSITMQVASLAADGPVSGSFSGKLMIPPL